MSSATAWAVRHRKSLGGQRRVPGQILTEATERCNHCTPFEEGRSSPPAQVCGHQRCHDRHHHDLQRVSGQHNVNERLQIHDLVSTSAATGVFGDHQERSHRRLSRRVNNRGLDAAAVVVDLVWSWAPLRSGLGHVVPVVITKTKNAHPTYALPRHQPGAWHSRGLAPTGSMTPEITLHNARTLGHWYCRRLPAVLELLRRFCGQLEPWTRLSCKRNLGSQRSKPIRYAHVHKK